MFRVLFIIVLCLGSSISAQEKTKLSDAQFVEFLQNCLKNETVTDAVINSFNKESRTYWKDHKLDYNLHPEKYKKAMSLFHQNQDKYKYKKTPKTISVTRSDRMEKAVANFQNFDDKNSFSENSILFVGSSSIAGWKTSISFPDFSVINRGIGGMNMHEIIFHYNALIKKYNASIIAIYCDIDIEQGKLPEEAVDVFKKLVEKIKIDFPKTSILLLSMKPVMVDDFIGKDIRKNKAITNAQLLNFSKKEKNVHFIDLASPMLHANGTLKTDIFIQDGMHLNELGYEIWNPILRKKLLELTKKE